MISFFCFVNWSYRDSLELEQLNDRQWKLMQSTRWLASIEFVQLVRVYKLRAMLSYTCNVMSMNIGSVCLVSCVLNSDTIESALLFHWITSSLRFVTMRFTSNLLLNWQWPHECKWWLFCARKPFWQSQFVKPFPIYFE